MSAAFTFPFWCNVRCRILMRSTQSAWVPSNLAFQLKTNTWICRCTSILKENHSTILQIFFCINSRDNLIFFLCGYYNWGRSCMAHLSRMGIFWRHESNLQNEFTLSYWFLTFVQEKKHSQIKSNRILSFLKKKKGSLVSGDEYACHFVRIFIVHE